jgi:G-patch domain
MAVLRGMGWRPDEGIGGFNKKVTATGSELILPLKFFEIQTRRVYSVILIFKPFFLDASTLPGTIPVLG